jgi:serine/threonine protein phosphatase PrpC
MGWCATGLPLVLAVSDGHGSKKCFRSDMGSAFAVKAALDALQKFASDALQNLDPSAWREEPRKEAILRALAKAITFHWDKAVEEHFQLHPFSTEELERLEFSDGNTARQTVEKNIQLAYGATLLATLVTADFLLCLQLGDGDILWVNHDSVVTRPISTDERLFANETTSLASSDAHSNFRFYFQEFSKTTSPISQPPALILLATDGYANSFTNAAGFIKVGEDLLKLLRTEGLAATEKILADELNEVSRQGSGDDITLGVLCCLEQL